MRKLSRISLMLLIVSSIFTTGCDAEKILKVISNLSQAIQKAVPAIKEVVETLSGGNTSTSSNSTASQTKSVSPSNKPAEAETNRVSNAGAVIVNPIDEEIVNPQNDADTFSAQAPPPVAAIDSINAGNTTVETTKAVIENLERALNAQEDYLKSHAGNKEVAKGIERLKEEIENRKKLLIELQESRNGKAEDSNNAKALPEKDLSIEVKKQIKSNQHSIDSAKSFLKEAQDKYEKYPNVKGYAQRIDQLKKYIDKLEKENNELRVTNIATIGAIGQTAMNKDKAVVESANRTKKEKIDATQRIISALRLGLALQKENLKIHPTNKDVASRIEYYNSELAKYSKKLSELESLD